jgi:competence protein ComEC
MKSKFKFIFLFLLIMTFFTGCNKNAAVSSTDETVLVAAEIGPSVEETIPSGDEIEYHTEEIYNRANDEGKLVFYFMDIHEITSQWGDSTLICFPNGETMMIDAGTFSSGEHIVNRLKNLGIDRIDYAIISHMHDDHFEGFYTLMKHIDIGVMYTSNLPHHLTKERTDMWEAMLNEFSIELLNVEKGDTLDIGDVHIEILSPEISETNINSMLKAWETSNTPIQSEVANNLSIVIKITYGDTSALFTGDIQFEKERELVKLYSDKLKANLLKIPHHGHANSGSGGFVKTVNADIAVVMGNVLMKPHAYTEYTEVGTEVYLTYADGMVKVTSCGEMLQVMTERKRPSSLQKLYN